MAQLTELTRLFRAIAANDFASALDAASGIAASEERIGHHGAARQLRGSLNPNQAKSLKGTNGSSGPTLHSARGLVPQDALTLLASNCSLGELRLRLPVRELMKELQLEWQHRAALDAASLPRRSRLLLHGPPGCGKSASASALGAELGLPTYVVRFDSVFGAYLGQTAVHLRELFRFAETNRCILLLDEVDALGKRRGDPLDVGELHRIVITLMQELEHVQPAGYVVATSNLPDQLDPALWRRFDLVMEFPRPDPRERERFVASRARALGVKVTPSLRTSARKALSYADAELLVKGQARRDLLSRLNGR